MDEVMCIYKPIGMTPLQLIERLRAFDSKYKTVKIGYAGRLDPLAHGVMLLTVGDGNKVRDKYLKLSKRYYFSVLFGVETDSYDYLGMLRSSKILPVPFDLQERIEKFIKLHTGTYSQIYPPFSSKPVNGVPLYKLAKQGKINTEDLPTREVEVFSFNLLAIEKVSSSEIRTTIVKNLRKIKGHFRQGKIMEVWKEFFKLYTNSNFTMANFEIECSSGTYVRSLAQKMGEEFRCGAIAFEIFRTQVGEFELKDALRI